MSRCRSTSPRRRRAQIEKALTLLNEAERPLIVAGGGIINADASDLLVEFAETTGIPVIPTLMGWGVIPDDHPLMAGMVGLQTSHRYGNATMLASDFVLGIGNRWANRHTGSVEIYTKGRKFVHVDIEPTQIGRVFAPDYGIVSDARRRARSCSWRSRRELAAPRTGSRTRPAWAHECRERKRTMLRTHALRRRADQAAARLRGDEQGLRTRHLLRHHHRPVADRGGAVPARVQAAPLDQLRPGRSARLDRAGGARRVRRRSGSRVVALSGDYDFQFMIEELAVGAQFKLPYIHVVVNNSYLGLIRQAQRGFDMDYCVQLVVRQHQRAGAQRLRRRPCRGRRGPRLQGDPRAPSRTSIAARFRAGADLDEASTRCRWSSK